MRKILVFENVTLDGFMAGPNGELDWPIRDDEITEYSREESDPTDVFFFGRITYDMMASFWPTPMGKSTNPVFADALNNTPKDEYQLMMNPVVLGKGKPLFNNITDRMKLTSVQTRTFKSGIVLLQYKPAKS